MADKYGRNYGEWFGDLMKNPASCGAKGGFFYLVAFPVMIVCGLLGLQIFPPGTYPTFVLIIPGVILGVIALTVYGWITYLLPTLLSILISIPLAAVGYMFAWDFGKALFGQLGRAF